MSALHPHRHQITRAQAENYLWSTAANNVTGIIGGRWAPAGYTLTSALAMLGRCRTVHRDLIDGQDALIAHLPGHGEHVWYLNLAPKEDPW